MHEIIYYLFPWLQQPTLPTINVLNQAVQQLKNCAVRLNKLCQRGVGCLSKTLTSQIFAQSYEG